MFIRWICELKPGAPTLDHGMKSFHCKKKPSATGALYCRELVIISILPSFPFSVPASWKHCRNVACWFSEDGKGFQDCMAIVNFSYITLPVQGTNTSSKSLKRTFCPGSKNPKEKNDYSLGWWSSFLVAKSHGESSLRMNMAERRRKKKEHDFIFCAELCLYWKSFSAYLS